MKKSLSTLSIHFPFSFCLLFFVLIQFNCQTKTIEEQKTSSFEIRIGSGGGFTGLFEGYDLHSNGKVEYWQHYNAKKDSIYWTSRVEPDKIDSFQQQLILSGILENNIEEKGNMIYTVTYDTPDTSYYWTWSEQTRIPAKFKKWYDEVFQFFEQMRKEK